jgi:glycosyltransferase involved in cell wall biosynthesis
MSNQSSQGEPDLQALHQQACRHAEAGQQGEAERLYDQLAGMAEEPAVCALIANDRAALAAFAGDLARARQGFEEALAIHPECEVARNNLALLEGTGLSNAATPEPPERRGAILATSPGDAVKVAVVSFLFNWPSSGGGIVHTVELVKFLTAAGYRVQHFFARYPAWGVGKVAQELAIHSEALEFDDHSWNVPSIRQYYRRAVDTFGPDYVILTDSWNMKPQLADALRGYPVYLRFQALECLCPLNNVRLLSAAPGEFQQCPKHQLATPAACRDCLRRRGATSGSLHQAERELAGVGTPEYDEILRRTVRDAEAVLVLNPETAEMLRPYADRVLVVPWGMDPGRFPGPPPAPAPKPRLIVFQAGVIEEPMKGFHILHAACERLWQQRQDFELVATGEPPGPVDAFTRFTGWVSQEDLPRQYQLADMVVVPTVAQEGLSRTSVEAMAAGRPVIGSRIGGLPSTVADGKTGLLFDPGDVAALAARIERLLDDAALRERLGRAGRHAFEDSFSWPGVIDRHYRPLLKRPVRRRQPL